MADMLPIYRFCAASDVRKHRLRVCVEGEEADPFSANAKEDAEADQIFHGENTGINFDAYEDIPVKTSGGNVPPPIDTFESINMPDGLLKNVRRCNYSKPTPVQRYAIPIGMAGRDLMACAQTGSGKTAAFCFPILSNILTSGMEPIRQQRKAFPLALVLSPTRELSTQIFQECRKFAFETGVRPVVVYGGAPVGEQLRQLEHGCDILVATPGRLVDLIDRRRVSLSEVCLAFRCPLPFLRFTPLLHRGVQMCTMGGSVLSTSAFTALLHPRVCRQWAAS
jgi:ATP-dependent RNA helicase DDX3X